MATYSRTFLLADFTNLVRRRLATFSGTVILVAMFTTINQCVHCVAEDTSATTWLQPDSQHSDPRWGHAEGLRVGIPPLPGPRGLIRVYAPYLGDDRENKVFNFLAIEPIVKGDAHRGLSELEPSRLDGERGKRFWSAKDPSDLRAPAQPSAGWVEVVDGVEYLRLWVMIERFDNGAHVYARLSFRQDRPYEVGVAVFAHEDSKPLDKCVVTATMGNYARLRQLLLAERTVRAKELWPDHRGDSFTPHAHFPLTELTRTSAGEAMVAAITDESKPEEAEHAPGTRPHWRYRGQLAKQVWRMNNPPPQLEALVNGRYTYWASQAAIPGGVSFENFELVAPFQPGQEFWFGVIPVSQGTSVPNESTSLRTAAEQ